MLSELLLKDKACHKKDIQEFFFNSAKGSKIDNLCLPTSLIHYFDDVKGYVNIVGIIDYPFGLSCTKARVEDINYAIKAGCKTIDLTLNSSYIVNDDLELIEKDIRACQTKTLPKNIEIRAIIEYRLLSDEQIKDLCRILFPLSVTTIITSTGTLPDDTCDNLIVAANLRKQGMDVIVCGVTRDKNDYELMQTQGLQGVRFNSINGAKNILGNLV